MIQIKNGYVLVTGGAGYIGSHICKALSKGGYQPIVLDNLVRGHRDFVKWGPLVIGNVGDRQLLRTLFEAYRPQAVIHCAGFAYIHESFLFPYLYYQNNVVESLHLLEEMRACDIQNIIFSSSCATYGEATETLTSEEQPQHPINPYGRSKLVVEQMIQDFHPLLYGILRYFNVAGADIDNEIGERHDPETHLIPRLLDVAAGKQEKMPIYGTDFATHDGSAVRDFIHVVDLAEGHVQALKHLLQTKESFAVNLGSERGTSVKEMIRIAESITGEKIPVESLERHRGDPSILVSNTNKAQKLFGWSPQLSNPESIITSAWDWHQKM